MNPAKTIAAIADGSDLLTAAVCDRSHPLTQSLVDQVIRRSQFSIYGRRPRSRDAHGMSTSDLDILSFLWDLQQRRARVSMSSYENGTPWRIVKGEQRVGSRRYGTVIGLVAHRQHLAFSLCIQDMSVVVTRAGALKRGAPRRYMVVDHGGAWHRGWQGLFWDQGGGESQFLAERQLVNDGTVSFQDYLHRERRQSLFGAPYLSAKCMLMRIEDELRYYAQVRKQRFPNGAPDTRPQLAPKAPTVTTGLAFSARKPTFTVSLTGPTLVGKYPEVPAGLLGYQLVESRLSDLRAWRVLVQFLIRADEVAFFHHGYQDQFTPWWVRQAQWQTVPNGLQIALSDQISLTARVGTAAVLVSV